MQILGCLGMLVLGIIFFIIAVIRSFYLAAFGGGKRYERRDSQRPGGTPHTSQDGTYKKPNRRSGDNRIYPDSVGEYVSFEEV